MYSDVFSFLLHISGHVVTRLGNIFQGGFILKTNFCVGINLKILDYKKLLNISTITSKQKETMFIKHTFCNNMPSYMGYDRGTRMKIANIFNL